MSTPMAPRPVQPSTLFPALRPAWMSGQEIRVLVDNRKSSREYPDRPLVGVGGVVIEDGRALLIRRGTEPLLGEWSIPGGSLELGETLEQGVARELLEETGLEVKVLELIEVFDRIYMEECGGRHRPKKRSAVSLRNRRLFVRANWRQRRCRQRCHRRGLRP